MMDSGDIFGTKKDAKPAGGVVWKNAADAMKIDVAVNADSQIWVVHDQPFPDVLEWVEFDSVSRELTFITYGGKLQGLGLTIHPPMDQYVGKAKEVCVILLKNGEIRDMGMVPLTVHKK